MDVGAAFVADTEASELVQPGDGAFHDPSQTPRARVFVGAAAWQERLDALDVQHHLAEVRVVRPVGRHRAGTLARRADLAAHRRDRIHQRQEHRAIAHVGDGDERRAVGVGQDVVFAAGFAAIRRARPACVAPPRARTDDESKAARDQSSCSAALSLAKRISWTFRQTPSRCHSASRRQHVMQQPQPISLGSISHWMPVSSTKTMPVKHARSGTRLRPGCLNRRGFTGMCGSMIAHNASSRSGLAMSCLLARPTQCKAHAILLEARSTAWGRRSSVRPHQTQVVTGRYHCRMGLDGVELVMEVEDRFRIELPDTECSHVRTVADLAALVISRLPKSGGFCPTARSFFSLRRALAQERGVDRRALRPTTPLEVAFPRVKRPARWKSLAKLEPHLPKLHLTEEARRGFDALGLFLLFLWVPSLVLLLISLGALGGLVAAVMLALGVVGLSAVRARWAGEFPAGCTTLGDLARTISPESMPVDGGRGLTVEQRVLEQVQNITAEQLGLEREKVRPESRFVEDLGMG